MTNWSTTKNCGSPLTPPHRVAAKRLTSAHCRRWRSCIAAHTVDSPHWCSMPVNFNWFFSWLDELLCLRMKTNWRRNHSDKYGGLGCWTILSIYHEKRCIIWKFENDYRHENSCSSHTCIFLVNLSTFCWSPVWYYQVVPESYKKHDKRVK